MRNVVFVFCSVFVTSMMFSMEDSSSTTENRKITIVNSNVPVLSIRFILLHSQGTSGDYAHSLCQGETKEWNFLGLEILKKPKLIVKHEGITYILKIPKSKFDIFIENQCSMTISLRDDSIVVATKKDNKVVDLLFKACGATLSDSR